MAHSIFGEAIDYELVTLRRRKWFPFQPRNVTMAPLGHMHFHPKGDAYCDDFSKGSMRVQGFFIHEMTHIWQTQTKGKFFLLFKRMPWAKYSYSLKPGWPLERYGIEQQAEIVRHAFMLRNGAAIAGVADGSAYDRLVNFSTIAKV